MPQAERPRLTFRIHFLVALCMLILIAVFLRLGLWQLHRAEQKRALLVELKEQPAIDKLPLTITAAHSGKSIRLKGHYLNQQTVLIDHQYFQGFAGYEVITAFELQDQQGIILLSRGWLPRTINNATLPSVEPISGPLSIKGKIHLPARQSFFLAQAFNHKPNWPVVLNHFSLSDISRLLHRPLPAYIVRLEADSPGVYQRHWREDQPRPDTHLSYAAQWFLMALTVLLIGLYKSSNIKEIRAAKSKDADYSV